MFTVFDKEQGAKAFVSLRAQGLTLSCPFPEVAIQALQIETSSILTVYAFQRSTKNIFLLLHPNKGNIPLPNNQNTNSSTDEVIYHATFLDLFPVPHNELELISGGYIQAQSDRIDFIENSGAIPAAPQEIHLAMIHTFQKTAIANQFPLIRFKDRSYHALPIEEWLQKNIEPKTELKSPDSTLPPFLSPSKPLPQLHH
jgi:hypothetical protein